VFFEKIPIKVSDGGEVPLAIELLTDYIYSTLHQKKAVNEYVPNEHIAQLFESVSNACVYELYFTEEFRSQQLNLATDIVRIFQPLAKCSITQKRERIEAAYQSIRNSNSEISQKLERIKLLEDVQVIETSIN
jgi:hypothetical protein